MTILFSCQDYAVCVKPVGMDSEHALPEALTAALSGSFFPVHRLDLNVGGVMVYARNQQAAAAFARMIQQSQMTKEYLAICHGTPPQCGVLEDLLWKDSKRNKVFVVSRVRSGVKKAQLQYQVITGSHDETTLIHIRLGTGRSHQIRVQFSSRGYPLLGDHKYGARDSLTQPRLFACRLAFPWHGKLQTFEALPEWAGIASLPDPLPGPPDQ